MNDDLSFAQEFSAEMLGGVSDDMPVESVVVEDLVEDPPAPEAPIADEFNAAMRVVGADNGEAPIADEFDAAMRVVGEGTNDGETLGMMSLEAVIEQRQIAAHAPLLRRHKTEPKFRQWQVDTGQVFGPAGAETTITIRPQCRFRSEKVMATDDFASPGRGTRILSVTVGNKVQHVTPGNGSLTAFFSAQALANGIKFDTSSPWASISIRVRFIQQCNFELSIFGTAEVDEDE